MSTLQRLVRLLVLTCIWELSLVGSKAYAQRPERPWNKDVIYFVMTDRFYNGDPTNDVPAGSPAALSDPDQHDIKLYHGGDLRGLELALEAGYFDQLGVTAIWISPPVRNVWLSGDTTGYHGYWTQDFLDIDPHLTSAISRAGQKYPEGREGRMEHYRDFVKLAHRHGIKVVQDIVCNHIGPLFFYDLNANGRADAEEWVVPYRPLGYYESATWANIPAWNVLPPMPAGPVTLLNVGIPTNDVFRRLESYGRKGYDFSPDSLGEGDGEEINCDFYELRDFWTAPGSPHFDDLVGQFATIYAFYVEHVGVDGFRIDTVRHVHHEFWDAFTDAVRDRLGEDADRLIMFGEVYDGSPEALAKYTYREDGRPGPCLDSLLNFQFCFAVRSYLRTRWNSYGSPRDLEATIQALCANAADGSPLFNLQPGRDGLASVQKMVNFTGNHDGLNRFRARLVSDDNNRLALGLTLVFEGIPCIYYGSEVNLAAPDPVSAESEGGRRTLFPRRAPLFEQLTCSRQNDTYQFVSSLAKLRRTLPALTTGQMKSLWVDNPEPNETDDDGIFALARFVTNGDSIDSHQTVIVVANAHPDKNSRTLDHSSKMQLTATPRQAVTAHALPLVSPGDRLVVCPLLGQQERDQHVQIGEISWQSGVPVIGIEVPPKTMCVLKVE